VINNDILIKQTRKLLALALGFVEHHGAGDGNILQKLSGGK